MSVGTTARAWWGRWGGVAKVGVITIAATALIYGATRFPGVERLSEAWPSALLALAVCHVAFLLLGVRWLLSLRAVGVRYPFLGAWAVIAQSFFYYHVTPLGLGADVARFAKAFGYAPSQPKAIVGAGVLADRVIGVLAILAICAPLAPFVIDFNVVWPKLRPMMLTLVLVGFAAFITLGVVMARRYNTVAADTARALVSGAPLFAAAGIAAIACFIIYGFGMWLGAQGFGIEISVAESIFAAAGALLFGLIPVSVFGVGAAQVAGMAIYLALGLSAGEALVLAALSYLAHLTLGLLGGVAEALSLDRAPQPVR